MEGIRMQKKSNSSKNPPASNENASQSSNYQNNMIEPGLAFDQLFKIGTNLLHKGQTKASIQYLENANAIQPSDLDCAINLSGAYILSKKFRQAVALLEPITEENPGTAMIWINLGAAYLGNPFLAGEDQQKKAIAAFERALEIDPAAPSVAYNIGLIYRDRKEYDMAFYWFNVAVDHNPKDEDARRQLNKIQNAR
jgi:tetratricopeptide (TPR) repeat protein